MSIRDWEQAKVSIERRTFKINCWEKMQTKCFRYGEGGRIKTTWPDLEFGRYTAILLIVQLRAKFIYLFTFDVWWELGSELQNGSHTAAVMLLLRRSASEIIFLHAFLPNNMCLSFSLLSWQIHSHLAKDLMSDVSQISSYLGLRKVLQIRSLRSLTLGGLVSFITAVCAWNASLVVCDFCHWNSLSEHT